MKKKHSFIYMYIIFALMMMLVTPMKMAYHSKAEVLKGYVVPTDGLWLREQPNGTKIIIMPCNQELDIIDTSHGVWYQVSTVINGVEYTGYAHSSYISIRQEGGTEVDPNSDYATQLSQMGFPSVYIPYLTALHEKHPSWIFQPVNTGLVWDSVIAGEKNRTSNNIKNTVQCTSANPNYNWRSKDVNYYASTNTWVPADGTTWFAASEALITYYLDPRTYLNEDYIFVFESLSYQQGAQTEQVVKSILAGTFMSDDNTPEGETETYAQLIMRAAEESGVSPYHIASRIRQEMGTTAGVAALGTASNYPGIYNFYNIGAVDTSNGNPVLKGIEWAAGSGSYDRPWDTPSKSIIGGAKYLAKAYISYGQDTLYTQKFNVVYKNMLYAHQYMTNVQAPAAEGYSAKRAYAANGLMDSPFTFKIPVYLNMPESASVKPSPYENDDNGNNNQENGGNTTDNQGSSGEGGTSVSGIKGDLNGDGNVSALDIIRIQRMIVGLDAIDYAADLNGDGQVTALDIIKLQRHIVGLEALY